MGNVLGHTSSRSLMPNKQGVQRGVRLFAYLAAIANDGGAVGISYGEFIAYLHEAPTFRDVVGRDYKPGDSAEVVRIAVEIITPAAGGPKNVGPSGRAIAARMDSFICRKKPPFERSVKAWQNHRYPIPYTHEQWLSVFPAAARRLITAAELRLAASHQ